MSKYWRPGLGVWFVNTDREVATVAMKTA